MAKEWILNSATNRFQLNFSRNVGKTSEEIRKCSPRSLQEWGDYYFANVKTREHLIDLGQKLYVKITEVMEAEIEDITEEDCINYIVNLVINRTYDGYLTEKRTIYGQLQDELKFLDVSIKPTSDEWDRKYNVDFYIKIGDRYIGLQIKPISTLEQIAVIRQQHNIQLETHREFSEQYGGKVFYIYSLKNSVNNKVIANHEVVDEIVAEIRRLSDLV